MSDIKVQQLLDRVLTHEHLVKYKIDINGSNKKGDGYLGSINFVTVTGETKNGTKKVLNLVIKSSIQNDLFRSQVPIKQAFEKEIFLYSEVKTAFDKFQKDRGLEPEEIMAHCYATQTTGTNEYLILDNLRSKGFELWDRRTPMDFEHIRTVLQAYGKWHALSLGLKDQKPEIFEKLTENALNIFSEFATKARLADVAFETFNKAKKLLAFDDDSAALKKMDFSKAEVEYFCSGLYFEDPQHRVILHNDCWTNNFMFKYEDDSTKPKDIRIIDWQWSGVGSPVFDLSYFLYSCCSKENYEDLERLLKIYHESLAEQLAKFGSNCEEVFSFDTLKSHWRRFSIFGILVTSFILRFSLLESDDAPDFAETSDQGVNFLDNFYFTMKNEDVYEERVKNNLLHYAQNA